MNWSADPVTVKQYGSRPSYYTLPCALVIVEVTRETMLEEVVP